MIFLANATEVCRSSFGFGPAGYTDFADGAITKGVNAAIGLYLELLPCFTTALVLRRQEPFSYQVNMRKPHRLFFAAILIFGFGKTSAEEIRVLYTEGYDSVGGYCMGMLKLALKHIDHPYEITAVQGTQTDAREVEEVRSGNLDLMWTGSSVAMEEAVLPVRIPLYKGLFGYRIFLIRKGDQPRFNGIRTIDDLKQITMAQGASWADAEVLKQSGFKVEKIAKYSSLFHMLDGGRYDAFPRGLQEPWSEITSFPELRLAVEQNLMLVYRMPFYFFVNRDNPALAANLELGLNRAIANGSFDAYFFNDPIIKEALARANIENRIVIELDNSTLPAQTPLGRPELWLDPRKSK